jgi:iron complex outermembrane recepter protein
MSHFHPAFAGISSRRLFTRRACALGAASGLAMLMAQAGPALAQDAGQAQQAPQEGSHVDSATGDIVVTALKRSESVLKVPAAISVLAGGDLKTVGVNSVTDLQNLVPNVNIGNGPYGTNVAIRGVTSSDQTSKGELGVAFNIDGAYVGRGQEQGVAFFDIDRIEVLRGPQGTLYGRSATGGAINIITKKPVLGELSGYVKVEAGNYNTKRAEAAINIPVTSTLAVRFAGNVNDRDGYLKQVGGTVSGATGSSTITANGLPNKGDEHNRTGRASVLFKPSDVLTANVVTTVGHIGGVGGSPALLTNLDAGGDQKFNIVADPINSYQDIDFVNVNETVNLKLGGAQIDLLANQQHFTDFTLSSGNNNPYDTGSATAAPSYGVSNYQGVFNTQQYEARLSNVATGLLDYVVGANYYKERIHESDHSWYAPLATWSDTSTWTNNTDPVNTTTHTSYGLFGQATLHPTDRIAVIGGIRYSNNQTTRVGTFAVGSVAGCTYPDDCIGSDNSGGERDHKVTWKVGLNYQLTARDLFYASVSTGFKPGGFNDSDPVTGKLATYKPETLTAYELGYKGRPLKNLTLTSAFFYYDYSSMQMNSLVLFPTAAGISGVLYTQTVPTELYGWENELRYQLDRNTTLSGTLAWEHSRFVNYQSGSQGYLGGGFYSWNGQALDRTPPFTANLALTHNWDLPNQAQVRFRAASKYSAGYYLSDFANAVRYRQNSFTRTDATLTYAAPGDRYTIQLFVENLENKLQKTSGPSGYNGTYGVITGGVPGAQSNGTSFPTQSVGFGTTTPRFYGVRLGAKF